MIKIVRLEKNIAVDGMGDRYAIADDGRGVNEKLWLNKENGNFKESYLIKFSTREENTLSDLNLYNEVICGKICKKLGLEHVDYEFCEFVDLDGTVKSGVICQNYRENQNQVEINGRSLHDFYCSWCYDNNYGKIPHVEINTVYTYIEQLKSRFESRKMAMSEETENRLIDELVTLALFDFCTCQIDRHWGNVGWINNNVYDDNKFKVKLVPIYDNECSFLLDDATEESLKKLVDTINSPKKVQNAIDMVNRKKYNSPYLGIKTSLVRLRDDKKGFLVPLSNGENNLSNADVVARELAHEINTRPAIKKIYDKLLEFDMQKFLDEINCIPNSRAYLKNIYAFVWNTRVNLLKDSMEYVKKHSQGEKQDETGLSSL